jgi:antitoxin (DNA-binding transcriptional repressor) of toxin-antitoxin stability system
MDRSELQTARVISTQELNQRTAAVLEEINESGQLALVSQHGRFVAVIAPLGKTDIESVVLGSDPVLRDALGEAVTSARRGRDSDLSAEEMRARLRAESDNR